MYFCGRCGQYLDENYHACGHGGQTMEYRYAQDFDRDRLISKLNDLEMQLKNINNNVSK